MSLVDPVMDAFTGFGAWQEHGHKLDDGRRRIPTHSNTGCHAPDARSLVWSRLGPAARVAFLHRTRRLALGTDRLEAKSHRTDAV